MGALPNDCTSGTSRFVGRLLVLEGLGAIQKFVSCVSQRFSVPWHLVGFDAELRFVGSRCLLESVNPDVPSLASIGFR